MFTSLKQRILLGVYIFIIISVPIGAYLASQSTQTTSKATEPNLTKTVTKEPKTSTPSAKAGDYFSKYSPSSKPSSSAAPQESATLATSYGPTLTLKMRIDGRPLTDQSSRLFIGIILGTNLQTPQYLLSFTVDLPASGSFENVSLAGLTVGSTYTAILKGDAQIATSSAFEMSPSVTNLNGGIPITMLSGDLNQDNTINQSDLAIAQGAFGQTSSPADLNKDGTVNNIDLAIINKNMGQIGATGVWASTPRVATPSASLASPSVGAPSGGQGYWVWVPK